MTLARFTIVYMSLFKLITTEITTADDIDSRINFPHSVILHIKGNHPKFCGASILNEFTLLSAANCVKTCTYKFAIHAYTGDMRKGLKNRIIDYKVHEEHISDTSSNDIAVLLLEKQLVYGKEEQPVTLLNEPPKYSVAIIAGWGWLYDNGTRSGVLQYAAQSVLSREACVRELGDMPVGTICGINLDEHSPKRGDTGDALMVHSVVQIGLTSMHRGSNNSIAVYTDVPYFYDWIQDAMRDLDTRNFCAFCDTYLV